MKVYIGLFALLLVLTYADASSPCKLSNLFNKLITILKTRNGVEYLFTFQKRKPNFGILLRRNEILCKTYEGVHECTPY